MQFYNIKCCLQGNEDLMCEVHRILDIEVVYTANLINSFIKKNVTKHENLPCGFGSAAGGGGALEPES